MRTLRSVASEWGKVSAKRWLEDGYILTQQEAEHLLEHVYEDVSGRSQWMWNNHPVLGFAPGYVLEYGCDCGEEGGEECDCESNANYDPAHALAVSQLLRSMLEAEDYDGSGHAPLP